MINQYGSGSSMSVTMEGPFGGFGSLVKLAEISLPAADWKNAASPYFQIVALDGVSINSVVDLKPTAEQEASMINMGFLLTAINDAGNVTVYAAGE